MIFDGDRAMSEIRPSLMRMSTKLPSERRADRSASDEDTVTPVVVAVEAGDVPSFRQGEASLLRQKDAIDRSCLRV